MVLSRAAVEEFLSRPLRDSARAKGFTHRALDAKIEEEGLQFLTKPRKAQKVCILLGWRYPSYLFLLGMGGGKTKVMLDLYRNLRRLKRVQRCLVLVPNIVNLGAWEQEVEIHAQDCSVRALDMGGFEARMSVLEGKADVVVVTYQGLAQLLSIKVGKEWKLDAKACRELAEHFQMLVADECSSIKNPASLHFGMVRKLSRLMPYRYGLTGTPFDKDPQDLWSQFYFIDHGYTLGETLGLFREVYFARKMNRWGGFEYEFRKKKSDDLALRLANRSIRYAESECQDLPAAVGGLTGQLMLRPVRMPPTSRPYYDALVKELRDARGNYALVDNAYTRMRMVSSGWLGATSDEGEKVEIQFKENPKLDAVIDLLREIPEHEKVIVVHWFNYSGKILAERLKAEKIKHVWIYGKVPAADKLYALKVFQWPEGPRVLLASTAISKGVNLQAAARYMVFFESPDSTIDRSQMEARILREGGEGARYFYDIVSKGTLDERILASLKDGKKLLDLLVDGREEL